MHKYIISKDGKFLKDFYHINNVFKILSWTINKDEAYKFNCLVDAYQIKELISPVYFYESSVLTF